MSLSDYFEQHEEQTFIVKAIALAVGITLVKNFFPGLVAFLFLILPVVFLVGLRMHAAASGVDAMDLLKEHITFFPMLRSEEERHKEIKPWVTYGIILTNALIYYFFQGNVPEELVSDNLVFLPNKPNLFNVPLSAFTAMFLHGSGGHLWGNMTFLWVVGSAVERRVGKLRFFWLYLATGLIGGLAFVAVEFLFHMRAGHALGASGAIAGIMGIFAVRCYFKSMIFPIPILGIFSLILPISLKIRLNSLAIMCLFFLSDLSGGIAQINGSDSMIGHWAHLGGMISGMLIAGYLKLGEDAVGERHLEIGIRGAQANVGFQGSDRSLQIVLERSPDNVDALLSMARLKSRFHGTPEGQEYYEKSLRQLFVERPGEVVEVFREYLGKYLKPPADTRLLSSLADALGKAGEQDLCITCLERLVDCGDLPAPQREKALYQLATLLEFTSCFEAARSCFARFAYEYPASLMADKARERSCGEVHRPPRAAVAQKSPERLCPSCGTAMSVRRPTSGPRQGEAFWVCGAYPTCRSCQPVEEGAAPPLPQPDPECYRLIFDGTIGFTYDPAEVKASLVQLFRCSADQVERLCNGNPTVLKRGLDYAAAQKYKEAICRTGALSTIEKEEPPAKVAPVPAPSLGRPEPAAQVAVATSAVSSLSCPKCGQLQEKGEVCISCGVYFAKLARLAEREFDELQQPMPTAGKRRVVPASDLPGAPKGHRFTWNRTAKALACGLLLILTAVGCLSVSFINEKNHEAAAKAKLANAAFKRQYELGKPEVTDIKRLLAQHDFKNLETLYDSYLGEYRKDIQYEAFLQEAYSIFSPEKGVSRDDLDLWVKTTGSYLAYAARGKYLAEQGFKVRGQNWASETSRAQLDEMQRLHEQAVQDLQTAIAANASFIPAYTSLCTVARASEQSVSPKEVVEKAEAVDRRAYLVRNEYQTSLMPRWGGSHEEMTAFAKRAVKDAGLNPRLYTLQGVVYADQADEYHRGHDYAAAVKWYTKALQYGDRLNWLRYRAGCNLYLGDKNAAIADYRKVLYYDPSDNEAQTALREIQ